MDLVIRRFLTAGSLRLLGMAATLLLALILSGELGPEDFGRYATAMASANVIAVLATMGLGRHCLAKLPKLTGDGQWEQTDELLAAAGSVIVVSAPAAGLAIGVVVAALTDWKLGLAIGLLTAILTILHYCSSVVRALGLVRLADTTNGALGGAAPQVGVVLLVVVGLVLGSSYTVLTVVVMQVVVSAMVAALLVVMVVAHMVEVRLRTPSVAIVRRSAPFAMTQASSIIPADLWAASLVLAPATVGYYAVARRLAAVVAIPLQVANVATVRELSAALGADHDLAQQMARRTARVAAALSVIPLAIIWLASGPVIELGFGAEYVRGRNALLVLSIGIAINVLAGPCGVVLSMAGRVKIVAVVSAIASGCMLLGGLLLAERHGAVGLAAAVAAVTAVKFVYLATAAHRRIGIWSPPLGGPSSDRRVNVR